MKKLAIILLVSSTLIQLHSQGYIVPSGVVVNFGGLFFPGEIDVLHNPANPTSGGSYTGFLLNPINANTFQYSPVADIGVRVFFVPLNAPITATAISSGNYTELSSGNYIINNAVPFYVGLYTGNMTYAPPNGIYSDPLFGWAELENVGGTIELLNSALEYQGGGIYAGTQNIIQTPEPGVLALMGLGGLLFGCRRWRKTA